MSGGPPGPVVADHRGPTDQTGGWSSMDRSTAAGAPRPVPGATCACGQTVAGRWLLVVIEKDGRVVVGGKVA